MLFLALLPLLLSACHRSSAPPAALFAREWQLVQYATGIGTTNPIEGSRITLRFEGDTLSGHAGCNQYFGNWEYRGFDSIAVSGQIGTTKKYCEGFMKQEHLFLNLLSGAGRFIVGDTFLVLSGAPGLLVFAPAPGEGETADGEAPFLSGYFMAGNEVSIFRDCADTTAVFWLEDETNTLDSLYRATTGGQEHQPVLLEIEARKLPRSKLGYASEYDGLIRVKRIRKIARPNPQDACFSRMTWG